jgi:uncharacterized protein (DUF1697 family)
LFLILLFCLVLVVVMTVYVALLRGVNVGSKNRIKMADLQRSLEVAGLGKVETYIQSGNIIFESSEGEETVRLKIEGTIKQAFGLIIGTVVRSTDELTQLIQNCPFTPNEIRQAEAANTEGESLYIVLLQTAPQKEKTQTLNKYSTPEDAYQIRNRDIYLLLKHSIRNSKLAAKIDKIGVPLTVRNFNTIQKLNELANARNKPN